MWWLASEKLVQTKGWSRWGASCLHAWGRGPWREELPLKKNVPGRFEKYRGGQRQWMRRIKGGESHKVRKTKGHAAWALVLRTLVLLHQKKVEMWWFHVLESMVLTALLAILCEGRTTEEERAGCWGQAFTSGWQQREWREVSPWMN